MVILKKKIVSNILFLLSHVLIFILFFFALHHEYKNQDDSVYYKTIELNSQKIFGGSLGDKNDYRYKFLEETDINILGEIFGWEKLASVHRKLLDLSKLNTNFCDVNKSKSCIYPTKDKNTCFISTVYNDSVKMSILRYEEVIQVTFVSSKDIEEKFNYCINQFLEYSKLLIIKKIENIEKNNSNLKNLPKNVFLDSTLSKIDTNQYLQDRMYKEMLDNYFTTVTLNNLNYYLSQVDPKLLKTIKKIEKKTLIQNFKFSLFILILGVYFFILAYKKKLHFIFK